jgi:putative glycosyltransferase (TIGR04372 family)
LLKVNASPLDHLDSWSDSILVPKLSTWQNTRIFLKPQEFLQHKYFRTEEYENISIKIVDLSPAEVLESVEERIMRIQGTWIQKKEHFGLHNRFWYQLIKLAEYY